jgi:predicted Fe-Mo cluster-binding NifX family protein
MKIAFPTLNGTSITAHFGRARGYIVVHTEDGAETGRELRLIESGEHGDREDPGHGNRHAGLVDTIRDCDAVVAGGMGHPIQERLEAAGLDVVLTALEGLEGVDMDACRRIAEEELGVRWRARRLDTVG